jgi:CelD/BcsL family acetyltransferase involved in cellulose biosynthesis
VLPVWLKAWWNEFGNGWVPCVLAVQSESRTIGIAPLRIRKKEAHFIGDVNVCDYLDFIVEPGREKEFVTAVVRHMRQLGIRRLDLRALRPDSVAFRHLPGSEGSMPCETSVEQEDVSYELNLPRTWEDYLATLDAHQRHELRRKLRRLQEVGQPRHRVVNEPDEVGAYLPTFLDLFRSSRPEKSEFMTDAMTVFFRSVVQALSELRVLQLHLIEMKGAVAAAALCFEYGSTTYLYNSGYDRRFKSLSVGLIGKLFTIRESIERGRETYDFLKGNEPYKKRLGGKPLPLYRCRMTIL